MGMPAVQPQDACKGCKKSGTKWTMLRLAATKTDFPSMAEMTSADLGMWRTGQRLEPCNNQRVCSELMMFNCYMATSHKEKTHATHISKKRVITLFTLDSVFLGLLLHVSDARPATPLRTSRRSSAAPPRRSACAHSASIS